MEFNIKSEKELQNVAEEIYKSLLLKMTLEDRTGKKYNATVIGLFGDLGAGKTTFTKYFAEQFGIKPEEVISPTFVLQKRFSLSNKKDSKEVISKKTKTKENIESIKHHKFKNFYHLDVYRINSPKEIESIGWGEIISDQENIILVEWAGKIQDILPDDTIKMFFESTGETSRKIKVQIN